MGIVFSFIGVLVIFQMTRIQLNGQDLITEPVWHESIHPDRGNIYDSSGNLFAGNKMVYEVGVELNQVWSAHTIALETSKLLGLDYDLVLELASIEFDEVTARYVVLANFVEPEKIEQLEKVWQDYFDRKDPNLNGLYWFSYLQRSYPEKYLASNVIGFYTFLDRTFGGPHFGIEEEYEELLAGSPVSVTYQLNPSKITSITDIPAGANLVLTIDREIQAAVENILDRYVEKTGATSGTIIVNDPQTGEILAMAVNPRINPNEYHKFSDILLEDYTYNRAIDINYEPGSVFKTITMAAALDAGVLEPDTVYLDEGYFDYGGYTIYNWDRAPHGPQTMTECIQHSLNVCLSYVAVELLGGARFYDYLDAFGIGHRTNIDLAGERIYPISVPGDSSWADVNLATNSFGQGLAVTPIQMVVAISAIANGGEMMAPYILKTVVTDSQKFDILPRVIGKPISEEAARKATEMYAVSLVEEASLSLVDGIRVAGKTGTAEISIEGKGYDTELTNTSFVGWGPVDDPKFLVYIWLEKPTSSKWGSIVAAPIFNRIVNELVLLMDLPPDDVRLQLLEQ
jgi:cell division protein FtsI/penicillin-binding protein 2